MSAPALPGTTSFEDVAEELRPPCDVLVGQWGLHLFGHVLFNRGGKECPAPAEWVTTCPKCGDHGLSCERHRRGQDGYGGQWYCDSCMRTIEVIWTRL
jgi:hypothetical protein